MWMTDYIRAVQRGLRDSHGFIPNRTVGEDIAFAEDQIPDGIYPMVIEGKIDFVKIEDNRIHCCRWKNA